MLESRYAFVFWIIAFRLSLDFAYIVFLSPIYTNSFLSFPLAFEMGQFATSWIITLTLASLLKAELEKLSDYFTLLYYLTLIAPTCCIFGMDSGRAIEPLLAICVPFVLLYLILRSNFVKPFHIPEFRNSRATIIVISWVALIYFVGWAFISGAIFNMNFDPTQVYDFRLENSELIDHGILAYINIWVYKFFSIFLISFALIRKNYLMVLLLLLFQFFVYTITAHKIVIFLPLLAIGAWYFFERSKALAILPLMYTLIILSGILLYLVFDFTYVPSMMIRRPFFVGSGLTYEWIEFFQVNPHTYWSDTWTRSFIEYPYDKSLPHVVGESLLSDELAANNGLVSTGYAHAGYTGIFVYTLILGYCVKILDNITKAGIPLWFGIALTVGPLRTAINDADLLTTMISHGLLISMIILAMYRAPSLIRYRA